ncbi:MAG: EAL domain-containing protein [Chloroflexi bacterium]|nr:EAL domain-containing protein [Chloroflexota bacterium]
MTAAVLVSLAALAFVLYENAQVRSRTTRVVERESGHLALYQEMRVAAVNETGNLAGYYNLRDERYFTGFNNALAASNDAFDALDLTIPPSDGEHRDRLNELRAAHDRLAEALVAVMTNLRASNLTGALAAAGEGDIFDGGDRYAEMLREASDKERGTLLQAHADEHHAEVLAERLSFGIGGTLAILVLAAEFVAVRWFVKPIERVGLAARSIASDDEAARAPVRGPVEIARLGSDVNRMADAMISRASEIQSYLRQDLELRTRQLQRSDTALHESEQRFRSLVQNATDMVTIVEADGVLRYGSPAVERLLGYRPEDITGKNLLSLVHPGDHPEAMRAFARAREHRGIHPPLELRLQHADGSWRFFEAIATNLLDDPTIHGIVYNSRDVTERKRVEDQLLMLADHDPLTGLLNHRRLREELTRLLAEAVRDEARGTVVFLDVDQFKDVNDTLGHAVGDELLAKLADLVRSEMRDGDVIGRIGGDEFIMVMPHTDLEGAQIASERLLAAVRRHSFLTQSGPLRITASLGISAFPDHGVYVDDLLSAADLAMYQSKHDGRNRVTVYEPGMDSPATARLSWHHRLREALDSDRFVLYAQPIVDLRTNEIAQFELLLRLRGDDGAIILPAEFLASADRLGLLHEIDRWVVRQAVRILAMCERRGLDVRIAANVSPRAFGDPGVLDVIRAESAAAGINPSSLVLEVTEDSAIRDVDQARRFMEALKDVGCRFALDDFGVGFSSLERLKHLPVDYLKIDGSFIRDLRDDAVDQRLVRSMVGLAHALGMQTIAEYVEDAETLELLRRYGVDHVQGFYLGVPAPVTDGLIEYGVAA